MSEGLAIREPKMAAEIRSSPCPQCGLCGAAGAPLYAGLADGLSNALGEWSFKRCPNPQCGLIWLDPMPLPEDIGKAYKTYYTHGARSGDSITAPPPASLRRRMAETCRLAYQAWRFHYGNNGSKPLRWLLALPILLSRIECDCLDIPLRFLAVPQTGRTLDVGCGDGSIVKLAQDLGWKAEGVDVDPQAVETAHRRGLAVHLGRLSDQSYSDNSFDLVQSHHSIEHVHDPAATLSEIYRILRPGGSLIVTTPNADSGGARHFGPHWRALDPPRHLQIFNGKNLLTLAKRAGFAQSVVSSTMRTTHYTYITSARLQQSGGGELERPSAWPEVLYGRMATLRQIVQRLFDPLVGDELLLEARK